ncbi:hypothetical protein HPB51_009155 [Rhipicephalus microplus]|uniref:Uncharacterized protein n=1 Tax=Rhipicephalus microplus TaxID=6941 RepID=A0A9J6EZU0_RHIMP|nr:hypothetical protein HPB51_009155 [Rhipicephalus microplus]
MPRIAPQAYRALLTFMDQTDLATRLETFSSDAKHLMVEFDQGRKSPLTRSSVTIASSSRHIGAEPRPLRQPRRGGARKKDTSPPGWRATADPTVTGGARGNMAPSRADRSPPEGQSISNGRAISAVGPIGGSPRAGTRAPRHRGNGSSHSAPPPINPSNGTGGAGNGGSRSTDAFIEAASLCHLRFSSSTSEREIASIAGQRPPLRTPAACCFRRSERTTR